MEKFGSLIGSLVVVALFLLLALIIMNIPKVFKKKFEQRDQQCTTGGKHLVMKNILFVLLYNLVLTVPLAFFFEFQEAMSRGFWNAAIFLSALYAGLRFVTSIHSLTSPEGLFKDAGTKETSLIPEDRPVAIVATFISLPILVAGNAMNGYLIIRFNSFLLGFAIGQVVEIGFLLCYIVAAWIVTILGMIISKSYREKKREAHKRWFIAKTAKEISGAVSGGAFGGYYLVRPDYVHPSDDNPKDIPTDAPMND